MTDTGKETELKPCDCPFCGKSLTLTETLPEGNRWDHPETDCFMGSLVLIGIKQIWEWNTRAPDTAQLLKEKGEIKALVAAQAEDEGLWFEAVTASEAYLQQEIRKLHAVIEGTYDASDILSRLSPETEKEQS